ncbi:MAG TPA: carbohydrate-binding family 9-like protein [Myxococcota bacterium]|nr:carbohydrate-binding family 9-like protein [Myxococcota bacterium]HRY93789.1 carbohydrate-binding family 9-like protein [Myxococcota bacterium]HSA20469.1 carbohydrate-binding family 9-like protein [Myxococcota bacterium]
MTASDGRVFPLWLWGLWALTLGSCQGVDTGRPEPGPEQRLEDNLLAKAPSPRIPVAAWLGPELRRGMPPAEAESRASVRYLGLDVSPAEAAPGQTLTLTHYWQVLAPLAGWKLFVHLGGPGNLGFLNADHIPVGGNHPVDRWLPGQLVRDEHRVTLPASFRQPELLVHVGLWREQGGRMKIVGPQDGEDRLLAARIPVRGVPVPPPLPRLVAVRATGPIQADGELDEPVWKLAPPSAPFVAPGNGAALPWSTRVQAAWDDQALYLAFDCPDTDVWGAFTRRDEPLWTQEAVEAFLDADGDGQEYIELQASPRGVVFDSYLPGHRRNQDDWNAELRVGVKVRGTLDARGDQDQGWRVELAVPWQDAQGRSPDPLRTPPLPGDVWRANFFRLDANQGEPPRAGAWSPPLVGDFHALPRFGQLVFQITPRE